MFNRNDRDLLHRLVGCFDNYGDIITQMRVMNNRMDEHIDEIRALRSASMHQREIDSLDRIQKYTEKLSIEQRMEFLEYIFSSIDPEKILEFIKAFELEKGVKG